MATALNGGRLTRQDDALQEGLETMSFELRDLEDRLRRHAEHLDHLDALEKSLADDVVEARKHVEAAERRQEEGLARLALMRKDAWADVERVEADRRGFQENLVRAGWAHQLRPEVLATVDGTLDTLAKRRPRA